MLIPGLVPVQKLQGVQRQDGEEKEESGAGHADIPMMKMMTVMVATLTTSCNCTGTDSPLMAQQQ